MMTLKEYHKAYKSSKSQMSMTILRRSHLERLSVRLSRCGTSHLQSSKLSICSELWTNSWGLIPIRRSVQRLIS